MRCFANAVAKASGDSHLFEVIPHPALLTLSELVTDQDFERGRLDASLDERAVAELKGKAAAPVS